MKQLRWPALLLALALVLSGCERFLVSEYTVETPHVEQHAVSGGEDALTAENYLSLKNAILSFVEDGVEEGLIRIYDYSGDVEEDLSAATYEVAKTDPLGAYAVDYMTHDCALIVSYYEVRISIKFRRTPEEIAAIRRVAGAETLGDLLRQTMTEGGESLVVRLSYFSDQDVEGMARRFYEESPAEIMELPRISVAVYPDSGYVRIVEIQLEYDRPAEELLELREAVATNIRAAREYVRYRPTEADKLQLLYTYLQERFAYAPGETTTPVYSFLCEGIASGEGCAKSLQLICDEMGLECRTVSGNRGGEAHAWNIVCVDGLYRHVDLLRALNGGSELLPLLTDGEMTDYFWDTEAFPACEWIAPEE
ncbi:MAG: transglutaminase domain-containing protein [Oscillospiraceae bacterium]|nr:transglutaminase domain-containing protein [Oscillospiraceae bacterium]